MSKKTETAVAEKPQAKNGVTPVAENKDKAGKAPKKSGALISSLSVIVGILLGVGVAYLQFQFDYADNPRKYFDTQLQSYIWVNVVSVVVPWFMVFALGTPMMAFTYVGLKRMLKI